MEYDVRVTTVSVALLLFVVSIILFTIAGVRWWNAFDTLIDDDSDDSHKAKTHGPLVLAAGILFVLANVGWYAALMDVVLSRGKDERTDVVLSDDDEPPMVIRCPQSHTERGRISGLFTTGSDDEPVKSILSRSKSSDKSKESKKKSRSASSRPRTRSQSGSLPKSTDQ